MGRSGAVGILSFVLAGALVAPVPRNVPLAQAACGEWRAVDTDQARSRNHLTGVATRSKKRSWVAGSHSAKNGVSKPLIKQWNGTAWRKKNIPSPDGKSTALEGIDVGRKGAVIAVGDATEGSIMETFALMRKAGGGWKTIKPADPGPVLSGLSAVSVLSRKRAWAVGTKWDSSSDHDVLIEKWNGKEWRVAPVNDRGMLHGVYARNRDDVWAVGRTVRNNHPVTHTLRFNGKRWKHVPSPNPHHRINYLYAVAANKRNDAWAVGEYGGGAPLAMHWNGDKWRVRDRGLPGDTVLKGVSMHGDEVVIVGDYNGYKFPDQAFVATWAGNKWVRTDTNKIRGSDELNDVDHSPKGWVLAAGVSSNSDSDLILFRPKAC